VEKSQNWYLLNYLKIGLQINYFGVIPLVWMIKVAWQWITWGGRRWMAKNWSTSLLGGWDLVESEWDFHNGLVQNVKIATGGLHKGIIPILAILLPAPPPNIRSEIFERIERNTAHGIKENVELAVNKSPGSQ